MSDFFRIIVDEQEGSVARLSPSGRMDATAAQELRELCLKLADQGCRTLTLDLRDIPFVASSAWYVLLLNETFKTNSGRLILASVPKNVMDVLKLMNIDRFFAFEDVTQEQPELVS